VSHGLRNEPNSSGRAVDSEIRKEPNAAARPLHLVFETNPISRAGPRVGGRLEGGCSRSGAWRNEPNCERMGARAEIRKRTQFAGGSRPPLGGPKETGGRRSPVGRIFRNEPNFADPNRGDPAYRRTQCRRPSTTFSKRTRFRSSAGGRHDVCETSPMRPVQSISRPAPALQEKIDGVGSVSGR
jgi:hypothetical protein